MKQTIYNRAVQWAFLLIDKVALLAFLLIVVVGLASCSQEEIPDLSGTGQSVMFNINVGDYHAFSSTQTRAMGTPDSGKNSWEVGDKVLVEIALKYNANSDILHKEYLTYSYDGSSWNCIFGNEKIPNQKEDASRTRYNYAIFKGYYNPAYNWTFNLEFNRYELQNSGVYTEAVNEAFISYTEGYISNIESVDFTIDFQEQMTTRLYSRVRVIAAPNLGVSLSGEHLISSWLAALNTGNTWLDNSYKARTVTDSNGNAFFFLKWSNPTPITIETYNINTEALIKQNVFTPLIGSIPGISYQIDMR